MPPTEKWRSREAIMLPVSAPTDCDIHICTPMDERDENSNRSMECLASATMPHDDPNANAAELPPKDSEMLICNIISPMPGSQDTGEARAEANNSDKPHCDENAEDICDNDEYATDDDEEEEEEVFTDPEEDCGIAKLFLNEVEIDRQDEQKTISELVHASQQDTLMKAEEAKGMRVAFGVILRLIFPLANGVVQGIKGIRDVRFLRVIRSIASSRQAFTSLFAFAANTLSMNLSSVQVSHRLEPVLKLLKIRKARDGIESLPDLPTPPIAEEASLPMEPKMPSSPIFSPFLREPRPSLPNFQASRKRVPLEEQLAPKCCTLNIMAEPPAGQPIRADIVFIHGLHGSQVNTWKQGLWENDRKPVEFERPPKPPVRPPKRPRHSRTAIVYPPQLMKRARFHDMDAEHRTHHCRESGDESEDYDYSFVCGDPEDVQHCDGIEYSFPTFRLRMNDSGRLLQAEINSILQEAQKTSGTSEQQEEPAPSQPMPKAGKTKPPKPSPNDPNYSKCWPGDWLPIDCPGVRVIAVNYTTDPYLWRPLWKKKEPRSSLTQRSREMAELLIKHRVGYGHPIVWVGHSKGGLFIKQIIVDAWESGRPAAAPFWRSARGVFFYSVPHRGSHLASIKAPLLTRSVELLDIEKNSKYLLDLHRRFVGLYHLGHLKVEVFSFVETALTLMSVLYLRIVGADSADPGIGDVCGIRLDHREICKPRSRECILYKQLVDMINKVC